MLFSFSFFRQVIGVISQSQRSLGEYLHGCTFTVYTEVSCERQVEVKRYEIIQHIRADPGGPGGQEPVFWGPRTS